MMRYFALLMLCIVSALSTAAEKEIAYWHAVLAKDKAPAFRYHLDAHGSILHVDLQLPAGLDPNQWGIHVWVADPAVVNTRVTAIRSLLNRKERIQHLLKAKDRQDKMCQDDLGKFLSRIQSQLKLYRDYDPFYQTVLCLPGSAAKPASLPAEMLRAGAKAGDFSVEFDLNQRLDLSRSPVLNRVSVAFKLDPISVIHAAPLSDPTVVSMKSGLRFPVSPDVLEDAEMLGTEPVLLRPSPGGYRLWRRGEATGLGCGGADGLLRAPGFWINPDFNRDQMQGIGPMALLFKTEPREGIQLRFFQGALAIKQGDVQESFPINLSSNGEEEFKLHDLQRVSDGYVLLMEITGYSRPYGGSSYCGAGEETDLVWIVLSRQMKLQKQSSVLINSCFKNVENSGLKRQTSGLFSWELNFGQSIVQYDPKKPLEGLVIRSTPLKLNEK